MTEIEKIDEAIAACEYVIGFEKPAIMMPTKYMDTALCALREKRARMRPEALTWDELKFGEPVFIKFIDKLDDSGWFVIGDCYIVDDDGETEMIELDNGLALWNHQCGQDWLAYADRPGEEASL